MRTVVWRSVILATLLIATDSRAGRSTRQEALVELTATGKAGSVHRVETRKLAGEGATPRPGLGKFIANFTRIMLDAFRVMVTGGRVQGGETVLTAGIASKSAATDSPSTGGGSP